MRRTFLVVTAAAMVMVIAGCSAGGGDTSAVSTTTGGADAVGVAEATAAFQKSLEPLTPPTDATPVTPPQGGKTIGVLSCGQTAPACALMADQAKKAVELLGWTPVVVDGKLNPQDWSNGDLQLINQKVDGIINIVAADATVPAALEKAKAANIPVVCMICANPAQAPVPNPSVANVDADYALQGKLVADYIIMNSKGAGKVAIMENQTAPPVVLRHDALKQELKTCSGCSVVFAEQLGQSGDIIASARTMATSILQRLPKGEVGYLVPPSDSQVSGVDQALSATGRSEVQITSFDCNAENLALIRKGQSETLCVVTPLSWAGWAAVDQMVRVLAGQPGQNVQLQVQSITKDNAPAEGTEPGTFDFAGFYGKLWGKF
ncbi:sugar ABC transporter substrate-binding protein [Acrocarpospora catenulata]|uniref:sugar ABC transporter substrate-binding protein n=1 Tax=Acrocarpospora catenulata TaxID=2836182 RepID=UPI001BDAFE3B|nr:sugar ABC transporter substrate-binding protein [Acrocarpospora catenulata]